MRGVEQTKIYSIKITPMMRIGGNRTEEESEKNERKSDCEWEREKEAIVQLC